MSDKPKFPRKEAIEAGLEIVELLKPFCDRIAIAGSIRRGKEQVGDIEILFSPKKGVHRVDLLTVAESPQTDAIICAMLADRILAKRPNKLGNFTWGPKNMLAIDTLSGIPVDLFSAELRCWWVALVIRTGGKETNLELTTTALKQQTRLHAYGGIERLETGEMIYPQSEEEVFRLCGVTYRPPEERL